MTTIRTVLAIAAIQNWHIHQLDVDNAFLHGDLDEDMYVKLPQDDIVLTGNSLEEIEATKSCLHKAFGIKDIGTLKFFLGLEVAHSQGITLCQRKYCLDLLTETAFPVQQLSQFLHAPTSAHFKAAQKLMGFSDVDWGGCPDSRRSITGYCFFIGQSLICWKSKKQLIVSKSSSEAEYRALASATCELQWLSYLLRDLQVHTDKLPALYCDSQSALHIAANPVFHERTKQLDIDCHIVREKLQEGLMKLLPIPGYNQLADILTKALHPTTFHRLFSKLGLINIFRLQLEGVLQNED
ncbi:hypothetical protein L195_g010210 [Trifolium pratense]|uniref:Reverse transcriptase Ty1/copia-type domain-containing protein n=1 Tax=Trifolium pratense TaxID=57577 RepID=A0A2K3PE33_TRIPR|nr:hypothetical protein L195_g010210 [Trifolium pratense]